MEDYRNNIRPFPSNLNFDFDHTPPSIQDAINTLLLNEEFPTLQNTDEVYFTITTPNIIPSKHHIQLVKKQKYDLSITSYQFNNTVGIELNKI